MDSAIFYLNKVIELKGTAQTNLYLAALGNSAYIYVVKKNYPKALYLYNLWEEEEAKSPNITSRASQYVTIGLMHSEIGNYAKAEDYLLRGLKYSEEIDAKQRIGEYYGELATHFERTGYYRRALDYSKNSWQLKDSLFNIEKVSAINELETKYQTAQKEKEIVAAQAEIEKKQRFQTFLLVVIGIIVAFSLVAIFLLIQRFKLRRALLSQEVDTLRLQINSIFGGGFKSLKLTREQINEGLHKPLSEREFEILQEAISDKNNSEIAEAVFVSVNTVKTHLKNIYTKLGVSNRKEALEVILSKS